MSPEAQRIAIAEACGPRLFVIRKPIHSPFDLYRPNANGYTNNVAEAWQVTEEVARKHVSGRKTDPDRVIMEPAPLPDYLSDLNAMHEAEKTLHGNNWRPYHDKLAIITMSGPWPAIDATAAQRAEAFLRTIGKWEDDK